MFPGIPIEDRYSEEFLAQCIIRSEEQVRSVGINCGMIYDEETDTFYYPEPEPEPEEGYSVTQEEVDAAYREGVNNVE